MDERVSAALGLKPGEHTLTLQATDADGQQDSEQVTFNVAPLDVPLASDMALDGHCNDMGYSATALPLSPYADGARSYAFVARTPSHLWVCLQGLQGAGDYAGLQIDVDNSQETTVQVGDLGFFVNDGRYARCHGRGR